jgi:hypothetical protein
LPFSFLFSPYILKCNFTWVEFTLFFFREWPHSQRDWADLRRFSGRFRKSLWRWRSSRPGSRSGCRLDVWKALLQSWILSGIIISLALWSNSYLLADNKLLDGNKSDMNTQLRSLRSARKNHFSPLLDYEDNLIRQRFTRGYLFISRVKYLKYCSHSYIFIITFVLIIFICLTKNERTTKYFYTACFQALTFIFIQFICKNLY